MYKQGSSRLLMNRQPSSLTLNRQKSRRLTPQRSFNWSRSSHCTTTSVSTTSTTYTSVEGVTEEQLNELAEALRISVDVETRKCKKTKKRYKQVFLGNELVEIIQQLAHLETRREAVQLGVLLQSTLNLFHCVNAPRLYRLVDDERCFYQFTPIPRKQKYTQIKIENVQEKIKLFHKRVRVRDIDYVVTVYKDCFVGKEAVDMMMRYKIGSTREECVEIGRVFQLQYNLFEAVTATRLQLEFEDDANKFYRLTEPQQEEKAPTFFQEIKPAGWLIGASLVPALIAYYYLY